MKKTEKFTGVVTVETVEVRFAFSGKVSRVNKSMGERVKTGELLASLERRELQAGLDKELADYERVRAEFEIFGLENPNPGSDKLKYEKIQKQAFLNASVKSVEIAKYRLDDVDLKSPVNGQVIGNGSLRSGQFITPGSNPFLLTDDNSYKFAIKVEWEEVPLFPADSKFQVRIFNSQEDVTATALATLPHPGLKDGKVEIRFLLEKSNNLLPGMPGTVFI